MMRRIFRSQTFQRLATGTLAAWVLLGSLCVAALAGAAPPIPLPPLAPVERGEYRALDPQSGAELWRTQWVLDQAPAAGQTTVRIREDGRGHRVPGDPVVWTLQMDLVLTDHLRRLSSTREVWDEAGHLRQVEHRDLDYVAGKGRVTITDIRTGKTEAREVALTPQAIVAEMLPAVLRVLPTLPGQRMDFEFITRAGEVFGLTARIIGQEEVDVPAGRFPCYKIELAPRGVLGVVAALVGFKLYVWHTVAPPHIWVKYQGPADGPGTRAVVRELVRFTPLPGSTATGRLSFVVE